MVNARQKGLELTKYIAQQIKEKGLDDRAYARGDSGAGIHEKTDVSTTLQILGLPMGIEAKNTKKAQTSAWWEQTKKLEKLGYEPVLVYSLAYEQFSDAKAVIYLDTLLELLKVASGVSQKTVSRETTPNRNLVYKKEKLIFALKDYLKELEQ